MKLINREYAIATACSGLIRRLEDGDFRKVEDVRRSLIDAPTVDAIPIQWLYDLAEKKEEEKDIKLSAMIKGVVALWHREQEKQ